MKNTLLEAYIPSQRLMLLLGTVFSLLLGCAGENQQAADEQPQDTASLQQVSIVEQINQKVSRLVDEKSRLNSRHSLMFGAGDYMFDGILYSQNDTVVMVEENGQMGEQGYIKRRFVLQGEDLLYIREEKKILDEQTGEYIFRETRYYYQEGQFFRAQAREAEDVRFLSSGELFEVEPEVTDFSADLNRVIDAVKGQGAFSLTFQELIELSGQTYILLGEPFTTSLRVIKPDETITKLQADPAAYHGTPLSIQWEYRILEGTKEAVYLGGEISKQ